MWVMWHLGFLQTEEYKQLREARDLEDLLFSGR
jgi:hypothetical protein